MRRGLVLHRNNSPVEAVLGRALVPHPNSPAAGLGEFTGINFLTTRSNESKTSKSAMRGCENTNLVMGRDIRNRDLALRATLSRQDAAVRIHRDVQRGQERPQSLKRSSLKIADLRLRTRMMIDSSGERYFSRE